MDRIEIASLDLRSRGLSQLRDTLAERQTIRIEYWSPYGLGSGDNIMDRRQADTTTTAAANVGSSKPSGTGGGVPAIKSIEIVNERNSGSSQQTSTDSTILSKTSSTEAQQEEAASEARQDNTTVLIVSVVTSVLISLLFALFLNRLRR